MSSIDSALAPFLGPFLAACHQAITSHGNLIVSLFLAGLVGSVTHCTGMCGPFVLAQTTARFAATPPERFGRLTRLRGGALLPYHLGRLATYTGLGAAAGLISGTVGWIVSLRLLSGGLLAAAALTFLLYAWNSLPRAGRGLVTAPAGGAGISPAGGPPARSLASGLGGGIGAGIGRLLGRLTRPLTLRPLGWRGFGLGLALGFLPCGLIYSALAVAAASGAPVTGAFAMAGFSLGTMPGLMMVGLLGHMATQRWRSVMQRLGTGLMLLNGLWLGWLAWGLLASG